jgi:hypothetical protein
MSMETLTASDIINNIGNVWINDLK